MTEHWSRRALFRQQSTVGHRAGAVRLHRGGRSLRHVAGATNMAKSTVHRWAQAYDTKGSTRTISTVALPQLTRAVPRMFGRG